MAIVLIGFGIRGQLVDGDPYCRRCRFNLTGRPVDSTRCAECGTELSVPGAVRMGRRRWRKGPLVTGIVLAIICISAWTASAYLHISRISIEPFFYLRWEVARASGATRNADFDELYRRLTKGILSAGQRDELAGDVLAQQADHAIPWDARWGDLIETMHDAGTLPAPLWTRYLSQCAKPAARIRPRVAPDEIITVEAGEEWLRIGDGRLRGTGPSVPIKITIWTGGNTSGTHPSHDSPSFTIGISIPFQSLHDRLPGPHQIHVHVTGTWGTGPSAVVNSQDFALHFTLLPAGQHSVALAPDASLAATFQRAFTVEELTWHAKDNRMDVGVSCSGAPMDCGFDLTLSDGIREWPLTAVNFHAGARSGYFSTAFNVKGPVPDRADLLFRASRKAASGTCDITTIWEGQFTLKHVPVKREK